jgi:hypothetical protein
MSMVALRSNFEDDVRRLTQRLSPQKGASQAPIQLLEAASPCSLAASTASIGGSMVAVGPVRCAPRPPAGARREGGAGLPFDRQLVARGWLRVEQLEREDAVIEGDAPLQSKSTSYVVQAPDGDVRPGATDVAEDDDGAGRDLDDRLSRE